MDEHSEGHEFALGFVAVDSELAGEGILIDMGLLGVHDDKKRL